MNQNSKDPLAAWADQALQQIPERRAPAGFSQRVLEKIRREAARPWYQKPWLKWPALPRSLSVVGLGGLLYSLVHYGDAASQSASEQIGEVVTYGSVFQSIALAAFRSFTSYHPWSLSVLGIAVLAAVVVTFSCGAVCLRLAPTDR